MLIVEKLTISRLYKQSKGLTIDEWINKMAYMHTGMLFSINI